MEGCGTWTDLLNGCFGRQHKAEDQSVELIPQKNSYGRRLMDRLEADAAKSARTLVESQDGLPGRNPTKPPLGNPRRPSQDLGDLANNGIKAPGDDSREHDNAWHEMLDSLHNALRHTRYSVSGRMAMSVWGCSRGARDGLSVICPVESKEAVKIWAVSTGGWFTMADAEPEVLTFHSQEGRRGVGHHGEQPRSWRIRIRWFSEPMFEAMPKVEKRLTYDENPHTGEYRTSCVSVLTLPGLLDNSAGAWADNLARGLPQGRLDAVAQDILSILDRVTELNFQGEGSGPLCAAESRHVLDEAFWVPFTRRYPPAAARFAQCGLSLPSCTRSQPGPNGGMTYRCPEASTQNAGRSLMVRRPAPGCHGKTAVSGTCIARLESPVRKPALRCLFSTAARGEAKEAQVEKERREKGDAGRLEGQAHRGACKREGRERNRKRERRVRWEDNEEKGERKASKGRRKRSRSSASRPDPSSSWPARRSVNSREQVRKQTDV